MAASSSRTHSECRFPGPSHWLSWNHTQGMHSAQVCAACLYLCHTCTSIFALLYTNEGEGWLSLSPNPFILFYMSLLLGFFVFGLYYFLITYICVCVYVYVRGYKTCATASSCGCQKAASKTSSSFHHVGPGDGIGSTG